MLGLGYQPDNDPRQVFMEATDVPPPQDHEEKVRLVRPEDGDAAVRLLRHLRARIDPAAPVTEAELERFRADTLRHVLVADGRIVSTATTNGIGIRAFQILGVVTAPDYRRRGSASAVCAALIRHMWGRGARQCVLFTDHENAGAQHCYERLGFRITGEYYVAGLRPPAGGKGYR